MNSLNESKQKGKPLPSRAKSCEGSGTMGSGENSNELVINNKSERESGRSVSLEARKHNKNAKRSSKMLHDEDEEELLIIGEDIEPENFDLA